MDTSHLNDITSILQASISPVALISGVGLLLLSLTNRFGRVVDRARDLARQARSAAPEQCETLDIEIRTLYRRSRILRVSIILASASILFASLLIPGIFLGHLLARPLLGYIIGLFTMSCATLVVALLMFMKDIRLSLRALHLELKPSLERQGCQESTGPSAEQEQRSTPPAGGFMVRARPSVVAPPGGDVRPGHHPEKDCSLPD